MKLVHYSKVDLEPVYTEGAEGAQIRWLIGQKDGAPNFAMRLFEVAPGGHTPYHSHEWEHENFIVEGEGVLQTEEGDLPFGPGDTIYVDPGMVHAYKNTGTKTLKFLCLIPHEQPIKKKTINPFADEMANNC
ncbi:cupin domain-containing protein [Candidatus Darwinibacter acetoxidans]|jgi:quercetin dioxygenase-like cupin family protein